MGRNSTMRGVLFASVLLLQAGCSSCVSGCNPNFDCAYHPTLDELPPGDEANLDQGRIAVDPITEAALVIPTRILPVGDKPKIVYAIDPDGDGYEQVLDMGPYEEIRAVFTEDAFVLMGFEVKEDVDDESPYSDIWIEHIIKIDPRSLDVVATGEIRDVRLGSARVSPSGRWVLFSNAVIETGSEAYVLDGSNLEIAAIDSPWSSKASTWLNNRDALVAARAGSVVVSRDVEALGSTTTWPGADVEADLGESAPLVDSTHRDMRVMADDSLLVIPCERVTEDAPFSVDELAVVNLETGLVAFISGVRGPVEVTPDGGFIVGFSREGTAMSVIDTSTLESEWVPLDMTGARVLAVSPWSTRALIIGMCEDAFETRCAAVYHFYRRDLVSVVGPVHMPDEHVVRAEHDEMWSVEGGMLYRWDLVDAVVESVPVYDEPYHVGIMPVHDRIIIDDHSTTRYSLWDLNPLFDAGWMVLP